MDTAKSAISETCQSAVIIKCFSFIELHLHSEATT